ncbi:MAG: hypothetical protein ABIE74_10330 [Pseudomonadota bacterium]
MNLLKYRPACGFPAIATNDSASTKEAAVYSPSISSFQLFKASIKHKIQVGVTTSLGIVGIAKA